MAGALQRTQGICSAVYLTQFMRGFYERFAFRLFGIAHIS